MLHATSRCTSGMRAVWQGFISVGSKELNSELPVRRNTSLDTSKRVCACVFVHLTLIILATDSSISGTFLCLQWRKQISPQKKTNLGIWRLLSDPCWWYYYKMSVEQQEKEKRCSFSISLTLAKFTLLPTWLREGQEVIFGAADGIELEWVAISFW